MRLRLFVAALLNKPSAPPLPPPPTYPNSLVVPNTTAIDTYPFKFNFAPGMSTSIYTKHVIDITLDAARYLDGVVQSTETLTIQIKLDGKAARVSGVTTLTDWTATPTGTWAYSPANGGISDSNTWNLQIGNYYGTKFFYDQTTAPQVVTVSGTALSTSSLKFQINQSTDWAGFAPQTMGGTLRWKITSSYILNNIPGQLIQDATENTIEYTPAYEYTQSTDPTDLTALSVPITTQEITSNNATLPLRFNCMLYRNDNDKVVNFQIVEFQVQFARDSETDTWTVTTSNPLLTPASTDWTIDGVSVNSDSCTVRLLMPSPWGNTQLYTAKAIMDWIPVA